MNRKILLNFLKDHLDISIFYFLNSFLISLFYFLCFGSKTEFIYPALIALFFYIIFLVYKWIRYYNYNSNLNQFIKNYNYDIDTFTNEQQNTKALVNDLHQSYLEKISNIQLESKTNKQFLSQWIHNMKTPITVMDLIIQKSITGDISPNDAINDIKEENVKLLKNLEQVLNIMRLDDFSRDYVPETIDLVKTLKKVINNRKNQFIYSKVFPKLEIQEFELLVLSDSKWNEVMLDQIISNAIKYSYTGNTHNTHNTQKNIYFSVKKSGHKVTLTIRDEGIGIPEYDIKRIFEPFFTGKNGRDNQNATGIGLYFCSQVAKKLQHDISINSQVGQGTEVNITYLSKL